MNPSCIVPLLFISVLPVSAFDVDEIIAQYEEHLWYVSEGIAPGDSFTYLICDSMMDARIHDDCYTVRMDFYIQMQSQNRDVWVVQVTISDGHVSTPHIFLMDSETLEIMTDHTGRHFADSIQRTLFYLDEFAGVYDPKRLAVGSIWGDVASLNIGDELIVSSHDVLEIRDGSTFDVFVLQYGFFETSTFAISDGLPFPISAIMYDPDWTYPLPGVLATFELLDYAGADTAYPVDG